MSGRCVRGTRGEGEVYREVVGGRESEKRKPAVWLPWTWPAERGARRAARDRAGWQRNCRSRGPPPFEFVPGLRRFLPRGYLPTAATIISGSVPSDGATAVGGAKCRSIWDIGSENLAQAGWAASEAIYLFWRGR